jgi:mRNA-degrading endonuclease RelE of RelBE toxin-antitoxin system
VTEYSGRFSVRVSKTMHRELDELAKKEGFTLNTLFVYLLSRTLAKYSRMDNKAARKRNKELTRLRAEVDRLTLKDGQFVARWEECPRCKGNPERRELIGMDYCTKCEGNGCVAVPVEETK